MNGEEGLLLPNLVPVHNRLILSPEAERQRQLDAIAAEEADAASRRGSDLEEFLAADPGPAPDLNDRVKLGVCRSCGHEKLLIRPAMLCEKDLRKAATAAGLEVPAPATHRRLNRAERRKKARR